jgi:hypothetical protein
MGENFLKEMVDFGKQNAHKCEHFISKIPHRFLGSVSIPPNTLGMWAQFLVLAY